MGEEDANQGIEMEALEPDPQTLTDEVELSLNSMVGISTCKTMKQRGSIEARMLLSQLTVWPPIISYLENW